MIIPKELLIYMLHWQRKLSAIIVELSAVIQ